MLVDLHPDVSRMVMRFNRWHHYVDYGPFKKNKLIYRDDYIKVEGTNEYGMELVNDFYDARFPTRPGHVYGV